MYCRNCGGENSENYKFCRHCGAPATYGAEFPQTPDTPYPLPSTVSASSPPKGGQPAQSAAQSTGAGFPSRPILLAAGGGMVLLLVLLAAGMWGLNALRGTGSSRILIGAPDRHGEADLYLLRPGQKIEDGVLLAEDTQSTYGQFVAVTNQQELYQIGNYLTNYGGFIPHSDKLLVWYFDDQNEYVLGYMDDNDDALTPIFDSRENTTYGYVFREGKDIVVIESRSSSERCYHARKGSPAKRVAKADACTPARNGNAIFTQDTNSKGLSLSVMDLDGEHETQLLEDEENISNVLISSDASRVLYIEEKPNESQIFMLDGKTGDKIGQGEELLRIEGAGFAQQGNRAYYLGENDDDEMELFTFIDGVSVSVAQGYSVGAALNRDGSQLIYLIGDEDDEKTLYVHPTSGNGEDVQVLRGNLTFALMESPERILIGEQDKDELAIYSASITGGNLLQLYREDDMDVESAYYIRGENMLYLLLRDTDEMMYLYVVNTENGEGALLVDEWAGIEILDSAKDGSRVVLTGVEDIGDEQILYLADSTTGTDPVELDDDADDYVNAVFTRNGKEILYTAITGYDSDEVEIRQIKAKGGSHFETLYTEAYLIDAGWDILFPFAWVDWQNATK